MRFNGGISVYRRKTALRYGAKYKATENVGVRVGIFSNFRRMEKEHSAVSEKLAISAVIICQNSARTIGACLNALTQVAAEVIVLDSDSHDGTQEICRQYGVRLVNQPFLGYSATKNLGNKMARYDWILSIDADEVLSDELIASLRNWKPEECTVYALDRLTNFCGKWIYHCGWYPEWKVRLFDRREVFWKDELVHETLHIPPHFKVVRLKGKLLHYSYADEQDHLRRMERYALLGAKDLLRKGQRPAVWKKYLAPIARFIKTYFVKLGILDGRAGWIISKRNAWMVWRRYQLLSEMWKNERC